MPKFRKKPVVIEATRWFKNGDHPKDNVWRPFEDTGKSPTQPREGQTVRYYRIPSMKNDDDCSICGHMMLDHGFIDTLESGHRVCPGDYIITGIKGEIYACKPDIFEATYERVTTAVSADAGGPNGPAGTT